MLSILPTKKIERRQLTLYDYRRYYIDRVLFEMVKLAKGRELALLNDKGAIRGIKAHALHYLKDNFKAFRFFQNPYNIYYSLAHLEDAPMFSFDWKRRKEQQVLFNQNFNHYFRGLDIGIDFDEKCVHFIDCYQSDNKAYCETCPNYESNFDMMYQGVKRIKYSMDDYDVPYQLKFSGSGFHINIDWNHINSIVYQLRSLVTEDCTLLSKWLLRELSEIFNTTSLDTSVTDIRRIWKMPYSIDIKTGNVALPLDDEQFRNFNFDIVKPENVIDNVRDRGLLERKGNSNNVLKYFKNFLSG